MAAQDQGTLHVRWDRHPFLEASPHRAEAGGNQPADESAVLPSLASGPRDFDRQVAEFQVRVAVLNGFTASLGIPVTEAVG